MSIFDRVQKVEKKFNELTAQAKDKIDDMKTKTEFIKVSWNAEDFSVDDLVLKANEMLEELKSVDLQDVVEDEGDGKIIAIFKVTK